MAEAGTRFWSYLAIALAVVLSADAARSAPDGLSSTATSGVLLSEFTRAAARSLLQNDHSSGVGATSAQALAVNQVTYFTDASLNAFLAADAAQLKLMKQGDKQAAKRATVRYYWMIACPEEDGLDATAAAAEQLAVTPEVKQYAAAGVVDTRNKLVKASLALVKAKAATKAQCIKYYATGFSAGYQSAALVGGTVDAKSPELWKLDLEILPDELDKLMPITAQQKSGSSAKRGG